MDFSSGMSYFQNQIKQDRIVKTVPLCKALMPIKVVQQHGRNSTLYEGDRNFNNNYNFVFD